MSTPSSGPPGPEFDPPASVPGQRPSSEQPGLGSQFPSGTDAGSQFPAQGGGYAAPGPQYPAPAPQNPAGGASYPDAGASYPGAGMPYPGAGGQQAGPGAQYPVGGAQYPNAGAQYPGAGPQYPGAGPQYPGAPTAGPQQAPGSYPASGGEFPVAAAQAPERVGLGLLAAAVVVLVCCGLTAAIYHWGFIASITAWLMAMGAAWAYGRFGGAPVKGRVPLLVLIVVGIVLGFLSMVASAVWDYYWEEMGSAGTTQEALELVFGNLFNGELWQDLGSDALFYFLFAALGAFGVIRRMSGIGKAKA